jgi:hypothetical protein
MTIISGLSNGGVPLAYTGNVTVVPVKLNKPTAGEPGDPTRNDLTAGGLNPFAASVISPDKDGFDPLPGLCDLARAQGIDPRDPKQRPRFIAWLNGLSGKGRLGEAVALVKEFRDEKIATGSGAFHRMNLKVMSITDILGKPAQEPAPTTGFHQVGSGHSLWSISEANLDKLLTDEQKKSGASHSQKVQWGVEELERRNPEKKFNANLQDGRVDTPSNGQGGRDPDLINDGEWIRVDKDAGAMPPATEPVSTTADTTPGTVPMSSTGSPSTSTEPVAFTPTGDPLSTVFASNDANSRGGYAFTLDGGPPGAKRKPASLST